MKSLKQRTIDYLERRNEWVSGGELQRIVATKTAYTPQNLGRRLREAVETGNLAVEYRSEKGVQHAWYKFVTQTPTKNPTPTQWFDELPEAPSPMKIQVVEKPDGSRVAVLA